MTLLSLLNLLTKSINMPNYGKKKKISSKKSYNKGIGSDACRSKFGARSNATEIDDQMRIAAFEGNIDEVKKCIAEGANVNHRNAGGKIEAIYKLT